MIQYILRAGAMLPILLTSFDLIRIHAQEDQLEVLVEQIAGANIYLRAGTDDGIAKNDTLVVFDASAERTLGSFLVTEVTASRTVVAFLAAPFPITRGTLLHLQTGSSTDPEQEEPALTNGTREAKTPAVATGPTVSGRASVQINALESTSKWLSNEEVSVNRSFATPAVLLRLDVKNLPAGFEFNSNMRGSYRYSSEDLVQPAHSMRVYQATLTKKLTSVPLQVKMGRFYNRYEDYSGYWDGMLLRYGNKGMGAGIVAGFEPKRANEGISTNIPKYTAFMDVSHVGNRLGYFADLSFHQQIPGDGLSNQTSIGWSQQLTAGRTRLGTTVQVHRDPDEEEWSLTRLHANGSLPVSRRVSLSGRFAYDKPGYRFRGFDLFSFERQQAAVGLRYWDRGGNASARLTANRVNQGDLSYSFSSSFNITRTRLLELGFHGAGTFWLQNDTNILNVVAGVDRVFGKIQSRGSYRFYRSVAINSTLMSHSVDAALVLPIGDRIYSTFTGRAQRGANQSASSIFVSLWTTF